MISADDTIAVDVGSFWEVGNYRRTVKRVDDGHLACKEFVQMVKERCDIEQKYATLLKEHGERWKKKLDHGATYGTTKSAWKGMLKEEEDLHDIHMEVRDNLTDQVAVTVKNWQKENYTKQTIPRGYHTRQAKEMEENFKRAQKPWAKQYEKVSKAKSDYHGACRKERTAILQERNSQQDPAKSADEKDKLKERVEKLADESARTKLKYEQTIKELNNMNAGYMEDMRQVFEHCQSMEQKRIDFFKKAMLDVHRCLNLDGSPKIKMAYVDMQVATEVADSHLDAKYWSDNYGVGMAMNWPVFEEFDPDAPVTSTASRKSRFMGGAGNEGALLAPSNSKLATITQKSPAGTFFRKILAPKNPFGDENADEDSEPEDVLAPSVEEESMRTSALPEVSVRLNKTFVPKNPFDSDMSSEEEETVRATRYHKVAPSPDPPRKVAPSPDPPRKVAPSPDPPRKVAPSPDPPRKVAPSPDPPRKVAPSPDPPRKVAPSPSPSSETASSPETPPEMPRKVAPPPPSPPPKYDTLHGACMHRANLVTHCHHLLVDLAA
ncbi:PREDICTED: protein kinase C and casein kinase substrate in neurons protein 2-like [Priapulus caudatus]|uniref:Protein kinase C and casein kinase substrate in neurons protein 2-like n=1 Tax=Priapulus caudatus TaxID=37621 RepID=A0ABM1EVI6_PRICU|nr:PREDICTED: protein kinase C and casein kinase substrate in neurons protein 2-like [Priapulus caudatus]